MGAMTKLEDGTAKLVMIESRNAILVPPAQRRIPHYQDSPLS
mgnify:CR=1 FL=1